MSANFASISLLLLTIGVCCALAANPFSSLNTDGLIFPDTADCKPDEELAHGKLPECEPTCDNPRPICSKMFITLDHVPCFCRAPLLRDTQSGRCVQPADCPARRAQRSP